VTVGFGTFRRGAERRLGFRSGDAVVDLGPGSLDQLLPQGRDVWEKVTWEAVAAAEFGNRSYGLDELEPELPFTVADYVDFYSSLEHATNLGRMFRPDAEPLLPNWRHLPVGYHGRAGNLVVSGTPVRRPVGQTAPEDPDGSPGFGPEPRLDFELELGFVCGPAPDGGPVDVEAAAEHIFGFVLVNDWSARSIQAWEYRPLGPFLGKAFATSMAAWITPLEALEPFRVPARAQDPEPLPYLRTDRDWALDLDLEVVLAPAGSGEGEAVSRTNARDLYWSAAQQLAHATVAGAAVRPGDLFASGTISGREPGTQGCLLELSRDGREPLRVGGVERTYLEDGDEVALRGSGGAGEGRPAISLAEVSGRILPAP
jgi:fumarylacetoacetase